MKGRGSLNPNKEALHAGRHAVEGFLLSLGLCLPSLILLSPSLGLAGMSTDSCKLLIFVKGTEERQSESLKRRNGVSCLWTLRLWSRAVLGAQCCLFQNSRINNCPLPTPCPLRIEAPPGHWEAQCGFPGAEETRGGLGPRSLETADVSFLFFFFWKSSWLWGIAGVLSQLDCWHTHWSLGS